MFTKCHFTSTAAQLLKVILCSCGSGSAPFRCSWRRRLHQAWRRLNASIVGDFSWIGALGSSIEYLVGSKFLWDLGLTISGSSLIDSPAGRLQSKRRVVICLLSSLQSSKLHQEVGAKSLLLQGRFCRQPRSTASTGAIPRWHWYSTISGRKCVGYPALPSWRSNESGASHSTMCAWKTRPWVGSHLWPCSYHQRECVGHSSITQCSIIQTCNRRKQSNYYDYMSLP